MRSYMRTCMLILVGALALAASPAPATTIGPLGNLANGHDYYVSDDLMTWVDAEAWAVALGGHLVTINDEAENAWVASTLTLVPDKYWIGARDDASTTDTVFEWSSGEPWGYARWSPGEPDDAAAVGGLGDYVVIDKGTGDWFDTNGFFLLPGAMAEVAPAAGLGSKPNAGGTGGLVVQTNESRDGATVRFRLPYAMSVRVRIYDVSGRPLRTLAAGSLPAGHHELVWDGHSDQGRKASSGVYFVSLRADGIRASGRVVITR